MLTYLFYIILAYSLYQLIFKFILPIYRTTRQIKKGFREMQERMHGQGPQTNSQQQPSTDKAAEKNKKVGDYIDFEEVKE